MDFIQQHWNQFLFGALIIFFIFKSQIMGWIFNFKTVGAKKTANMIHLQERPCVVLDVRTQGEFQSGHIRGSVNVPLHELGQNISKLEKKYANHDVFVICQSGSRSLVACLQLKKSTLKPLYNVRGGMMGWGLSGDKKLLER